MLTEREKALGWALGFGGESPGRAPLAPHKSQRLPRRTFVESEGLRMVGVGQRCEWTRHGAQPRRSTLRLPEDSAVAGDCIKHVFACYLDRIWLILMNIFGGRILTCAVPCTASSNGGHHAIDTRCPTAKLTSPNGAKPNVVFGYVDSAESSPAELLIAQGKTGRDDGILAVPASKAGSTHDLSGVRYFA